MVDIAKIKEFNDELNRCKQEAEKVKMERAVTEKEIERLCAELTEELGREVTTENAEDIFKEFMDKVENTITTGEEIFERIKAEAEVNGGLV